MGELVQRVPHHDQVDLLLVDDGEVLDHRPARPVDHQAQGGRLAGLVCLKRKLTGFCCDADVAERAAEAQGPAAGSTVAFHCMPIAR